MGFSVQVISPKGRVTVFFLKASFIMSLHSFCSLHEMLSSKIGGVSGDAGLAGDEEDAR